MTMTSKNAEKSQVLKMLNPPREIDQPNGQMDPNGSKCHKQNHLNHAESYHGRTFAADQATCSCNNTNAGELWMPPASSSAFQNAQVTATSATQICSHWLSFSGAIRRKRLILSNPKWMTPCKAAATGRNKLVSLQTLICTLPKPRTINTFTKNHVDPDFLRRPAPSPVHTADCMNSVNEKHGWSQPQHCRSGHVCLRKVGNPLLPKSQTLGQF